MQGRAATRLLIVLGVLACLWLVLLGTGLIDFRAEGEAPRSSNRDPLGELEEELFEEMQRGATLRGLPGIEHRLKGSGALTGKVLLYAADGEPRPLAGVEILVLGRAETSPRDALAAEDGAPRDTKRRYSQQTQDDGTFTFTRLPASAGYVLIVDHEPYRRIVMRSLVVLPDRTANVGTLTLGAPTSLTGEVVDAKGRAVKGARVQVLRDTSRRESFDIRSAFFELQGDTSHLAETLVEGDGRFVLEDLPPGRYLLRVSAGGYATTFKDGVYVTVDENSSEVRVVLDAGAGFHGKVLDETGRGIGDARVIAIAIPGKRLNRFDRVETRTEGDGSYRLDTLIAGMSYGVEAWAEGYAPTGRYLPVVSGMKRQDWKLEQSGRVEGRVTDAETGVGVAECIVTVIAGQLSGMSPVSTTTSADGAFVLPHVHTGPIILFSAKAPGYQPNDGFDLAAVKGMKVAAGETTWVDWKLKAGGGVEGRVTSDGGRPVGYASVALVDRRRSRQRLTGEITAMTDADGMYHLIGVRPGEYDVRVTAPGYAPPTDSKQTLVKMGAALGLVRKDVVLVRGAALDGSVTAPDGVPIKGARVWLEAASGRDRDSDLLRDLTAVSRSNGGFRITGIPPQMAVIAIAEHDRYVKGVSETLRLSAGQQRGVAIQLRPGVKLPGGVIDGAGAPVGAARIRWGNVDGVRDRDLRHSFDADEYLGSRVLRTGDDGRFVIDGLEPGKLLLKIEKEGFAAWYRRDLRIGEEGLQPAITATLESTLRISGRVTAADTGNPLAGAFVYARERGPAEGQPEDPGRVQALVSAETDAAGRYVLDRVPPGTHEVVVWFAEGYMGAAQARRDPELRKKARRKGVPAGSTGVDFKLDPIPPPAESEPR